MTEPTPTPAMTTDAQPERVENTWTGDPHRVASELRRVANTWKPHFKMGQLLRDAADEIESLTALAERPVEAVDGFRSWLSTQVSDGVSPDFDAGFEVAIQGVRDRLIALAERPVEAGVLSASDLRDHAIRIVQEEARDMGYCDDDVAAIGSADGDDGLAVQAVERAMLAAATPPPTADAMR